MTDLTKKTQRTYRVEGMDCGSCAATLTTAIAGLPGVDEVEVSVARERMTLHHDPIAMTSDRIEKTVRSLGFTAILQHKATPQADDSQHTHSHSHHGHDHSHACHGDHDHKHGHDHMQQHSHACCSAAGDETTPLLSDSSQQFRIEGMDCGSCAATITSALSGLPGVSNANVSVAREILTLDLDVMQTAVEDIEKTVHRLGFIATSLQSESKNSAPSAWWNTAKTRHLATSIVLSVFALIGSLITPELEPVLLTATVAIALFPIAKRAFIASRLGAFFTIQMLMSIAAIGAVIIGEQLEALLVVLLFMVGEFLEGLAAEKARSGIKALGALLPREAWLLEGDTPRQVDAEALRIDQIVLVRPGDRIPADGAIIQGFASVDESPVTGESVPVSKGPGDEVFAGTINCDATLHVKVSKAAENNTIARIISMVEEAQDSKAPTERFIERFSRIYMPIIIAIAVAVAVVPPLADWGSWETWTYRALALLLIGCPCALVISVPAAIAASLSAGARHGILIKGGAVMEQLARASAVVFDKTGTLTEGKPEVTDIVSLGGSENDLLELVSGVEQGSSHPLAEAICRESVSRDILASPAIDVRIVPGKGMQGLVNKTEIFIGAPRFAAERATISKPMQDQISELESAGKTVVVVTRGADIAGLIALRDEPRATTPAGLVQLKSQGINAIMMTGDNQRTAAAIAVDLGIEIQAEMLPKDKAGAVRALAKKQTVMMVGDGVNDAPALAESHVGIAIGSGTDVAMEAANAAIMRNDIGDVARMVHLARGTMSIVRQNVYIAIGLKALFLVTTVTGISGLWMAVMADTGATVLVTLNAMRLLAYLRTKSETQPGTSLPGNPDPIRP
jgi:Zn2+/Cd2+-exporting ATPase